MHTNSKNKNKQKKATTTTTVFLEPTSSQTDYPLRSQTHCIKDYSICISRQAILKIVKMASHLI